MSQTADADDAVEAAAFAALDAGVTLAPVHQHVPQDTAPPVVIVGDIDDDPTGFASKDDEDGDREISLTIVTVIQGEARKPLTAIQREVRLSLSGLDVVQDGWRLVFRYLGREGQLLEDGTTYVGNSRFSVTALRAD